MIWKQLMKLSTVDDVLTYLKKNKAYVPYNVNTIPPAFVAMDLPIDDTETPMSFKGFRKSVIKLLVLMDGAVPATTYIKVPVKGLNGWIDDDRLSVAECSAERIASCEHSMTSGLRFGE